MTAIKPEKRFQPAQFLAISFIIAIAIGTILLYMPFSTKEGHISFIDAFFTATSAVCVTGLIVQDTATYFTTYGKLVIMILFQLGGLGIMTFSTLIMIVAGKSISIKDRLIIQEGFHHASQRDVKSLIKSIFMFAFIIEALASISLFLRWRSQFSLPEAVFHSVFHSISAFCNAGFSLFSDSFMGFREDAWVNGILIFLIVFGGAGFLVLQELKRTVGFFVKKKRIRVSLHTKLVVLMTVGLIVCSWVVFLGIEWNHSLENFSVKEKLLSSVFQVITPRTAGFNTLDLNTLTHGCIFLLVVLMFIGASPGSTGGGVKTSTFGVIFAFLKSKIVARDTVNIFYRTLPLNLIIKALTIFILAICVISFSIFILLLVQPEARVVEVIFESFSAFGTVGLSLGLTPKLTTLGKAVIIFTMYTGRIGPLTLLYAFSRKRSFGRYTYVEESVMIG